MEGGAGAAGVADGAAGADGIAGTDGIEGIAGAEGRAGEFASWISPFTVMIFREYCPPFTSPDTRRLPGCE